MLAKTLVPTAEQPMKHKERLLTKERIDELFVVDIEKGKLYWRIDKGSRAKKGEMAGTFARGYNAVKVDYILYKVHRIIHFYKTGVWPLEVDHKDRDSTNNRDGNLRAASASLNRFNRIAAPNKTGRRGVYAANQKGKFVAQIKVQGKRICLGTFNSIEEAAFIRYIAELRYFGEAACV